MATVRSWIPVVALLALVASAACNAGHLGEPPPDPVSPGTVTVRLVLPSTRTFCDQVSPCGGKVSHVSFSTDSGELMDLGWGWCRMTCSSECFVHSCPAIFCGGPGAGVAVTDVSYTWDGAFVQPSKCGNNYACDQPSFVLPGSYVAHLCATPGTLVDATDAGPASCTPTGPEECVDLPFNLPGQPLVEATLPQ